MFSRAAMQAIKLSRPFLSTYGAENYNPTLVIATLLSENDIKVEPWDFQIEKMSGVLLPPNKLTKKYTILVNRMHPSSRRLFTLSHELGHFYLHRTEQEFFYCNDLLQQEQKKEREANEFAAELLMPTEVMRFFLAKKWSLEQIAKQLGVSLEAMKWRYINLLSIYYPKLSMSLKQKLF